MIIIIKEVTGIVVDIDFIVLLSLLLFVISLAVVSIVNFVFVYHNLVVIIIIIVVVIFFLMIRFIADLDSEAITEMANKGYEHADLHWRHVALLPVPPTDNSNSNERLWKVKPILIDLHRVNKISPGQEEEIITKSMKILSMEQQPFE